VSRLRAARGALLLVVLSVVLALPALAVSLLRICGPFGDRLALRAVLRVQQAWFRGALAILGVRVVTRGTPPREPCVLVANHLSYLDVALLGAARPCRFVAKSDVAGWPGIGWLARLARVLFVRREERRDLLRVGDELRRTLAAGIAVAFFPEGTSTRGLDVRPFHSGLLQPAAEAGLPCLPVAIRYETPAGAPAPSECVCWWGDMTFPPHLWRLMTLSEVQAEVTWGERPVRAGDRKRLAAELHAQVAARFVPVRQETGPARAASSPAEISVPR
jgi:1-acyl-sn-glycerol-3-phosphate acyltransferase